MARRVTLATPQWADMPLDRLVKLVKGWGFDGLELACWGVHVDVVQAVESDGYARDLRELLEQHGLQLVALAAHLVGQAVADKVIDERHKGIVPPRVWGDGDPEGVRRRAAEELKTTAHAAARLGVKIVTGFTGSPIWHALAMFPPVPPEMIEAGYREFADRWNPVIDEYDRAGVKFALEVHPGEIAYDFWTTRRALDAIGNRQGFGINFDPSHLYWQMLDPVEFVYEYGKQIYHMHVKESVRNLNGRNSILASHLFFGDHRRGWDFVSPGRGGVPFERIFRALNDVGYAGPLSIEWEDNGMNREHGAPEALALVRRLDLTPSTQAFDDAFKQK